MKPKCSPDLGILWVWGWDGIDNGFGFEARFGGEQRDRGFGVGFGVGFWKV